MKAYLLFIGLQLLILNTWAALPSAPTEAQHPGSKIYTFGVKEELLICNKREVYLFVPTINKINSSMKNLPAVIYGHGQALKIEHYRGTLEHLARKGIVAIYPTYDTGFFDREWQRMGRDYVALTNCALEHLAKNSMITVDEDRLVYSGHSKGAYVAGIAAGLSFKENLALKPKAVMLFEAAGSDEIANRAVAKDVLYNVIYSDKDKIVKRDISESIYNQVPVSKKQFIFVKSYPELEAGHFWPLTKPSTFGGENENAFHYYSSWKWLVAIANDLKIGGYGNDSYLYGENATDKGIPNVKDDLKRNW